MEIADRQPRESGRDYALRVIKENIINLELAPESQISEAELAAELGLSRTPVREALLELDKVKIIKIVPQKRSMVAPIDYRLVDEACFMRESLERSLIRLICQISDPLDLSPLEENVRLQYFYLEKKDFRMLMQLDNLFHALLFELAQKPQVYRLLQDITIHFDRVRRMALESVKELKIVQDHEEMLKAISRRDPEQADALMQLHLSRYKFDAAIIREKFPQYFHG